jgi:methionyl aminopeptidase
MDKQPPTYLREFDWMKHVGALTAKCLDELARIVVPEITTLKIDKFVRDFADDHGLRCAPEGYRGFPAACCTSVNHVICHGIPSEKILHEGDIVKIDVTFINKEGWHGDSCRTYPVGEKINPKIKQLIDVTRNAMYEGIKVAVPGNVIGDIGKRIQHYVEGEKFSVVRDFVGHGIGQDFHCPPAIPHYNAHEIPDIHRLIMPGQMFTIEPMVNIGRPDYKTLSDGWAVVTKDKSWSAQFEVTLGITETGNIIFTPMG